MHIRRASIALAFLLAASPVAAHHRQTPPVVAFSTMGDDELPRGVVTGGTIALARARDDGHEVVRFQAGNLTTTPVSAVGDCRHATVSGSGGVVAWDTDGDPLRSGDPGRQVVLQSGSGLIQAAHDPTGTSGYPALNRTGRVLAFESAGDLADTGNAGAYQVFVRDQSGMLRQMSRGQGSSHDAALARGPLLVAFDSTSDPTTGVDTGIAQVWLAGSTAEPAAPITAGLAPSRRPALSPDGRLVAFESRAKLDGTGEDTGAAQIFVYDRITARFAQLTDDPRGCSGPSADFYLGDWRVVYACGGQAFYHQLLADQRFQIPIDAGDTSGALAVIGSHFVAVATTANLTGTGTTAGHRLFLWNLFRLPPRPVAGRATWFVAPPPPPAS
jgi:Tol biopolymer transport system component